MARRIIDILDPIGIVDSAFALWDRLPETVRGWIKWAAGTAVTGGWAWLIAINDAIAGFGAFGYAVAVTLALGLTAR